MKAEIGRRVVLSNPAQVFGSIIRRYDAGHNSCQDRKHWLTCPRQPLGILGLAIILTIGLAVEFTFGQQSSKDALEFLGMARIEGTATDLTDFTELFEDSTPHNQFGGISGIEWIEGTDLFRAVADRGPNDGAVDYRCRFHDLEIKIDPKSKPPVSVKMVRSVLLKNAAGVAYSGSSKVLQDKKKKGRRFDPEGIRIDGAGNTWISDEYGPYLIQFDADGQFLKELAVPKNLQIANPSANPKNEDNDNTSGRRANRGMEGLAIAPSGRYLYGIMQSALLQDGYRDNEDKTIGNYARLIRFDLESGTTEQYFYRLEHPKNKLHEILAVDESRFLILEQDGKVGSVSKCKQIFLIDVSQATPVGEDFALAGKELPKNIKPVAKAKKPMLDLLDRRYGIGASMPEKVEGICWGKELPDGRRVLVVATDNDFRADQATELYVFTVSLNHNGRFSLLQK